MATISENLQTIKDSTVNIKNAIINKGGAVTGDMTTYALAIDDLDLSQSTLASTSGILKVDGILGGAPLNDFYTDNVVGIYYMTDSNIFAAKSSDDLYYLRWENANDYNNVVNNTEQAREGKIYELNKDYYTIINGTFRRLSETTLAKNITNDLGTSERLVVSQKTVTEKLNSLGYTYISTATPSTTPVTLKGGEKVFYIAVEEGDYSNFGLGNISELSIIKSEKGSWKIDALSFFQKEIKSEDVRLSEFLISDTTIKPDGSVQSANETYSVYKFQNKGYLKLQGIASGYSGNYLIALYSDESCSSDSFLTGIKVTSAYSEQLYSLEVPSECKIIVISQHDPTGLSTCTASTYFSYPKLDKLEDKLTELDNVVNAQTVNIIPFKKTQGVYFRKDGTKVSLASSETCAMWEYKIDNISSKQIQVNISQSTLAGTTGLGPAGVVAGLFLSNGSENPSDYTCISVLQEGDTAIFDYELNVPLLSSADLLCVSLRQNLNEDSKASVTTNSLSLIERIEILENNMNNADAEDPNYDGVAVVRSGSSILGFGASFMRGNSGGTGASNSWLHTLADSLGCTAINDALGGTKIMYHANRLFNSEIYTDSQIDNIDAVVIMHTHDKDVFTLPSEFVNYSVEDYESNVLPFATTTGANEEDVMYAKGFDYVIKKIYQLNFLHKYDTSYTDSMHQYVGIKYFKPTQIVLVTNWHDQREVYNKSIRKLASKWGLPLIQLDKKIGFTKNMLNPAFNSQPSLEFVGNVGGSAPIETINGVAYGWHPMCGNNEVFIQRKIAAICKQSFVSI